MMMVWKENWQTSNSLVFLLFLHKLSATYRKNRNFSKLFFKNQIAIPTTTPKIFLNNKTGQKRNIDKSGI